MVRIQMFAGTRRRTHDETMAEILFRGASVPLLWLTRAPRVDAPPAWYDLLDAPEVLLIATEEHLWLKLVWVVAAAVIVTIAVLTVRDEWKRPDANANERELTNDE